jgi:type IV secretion system protein VirB2
MKTSKSLLLCLTLFGVHSVAFAQFAAATTALTQIQGVMKSLGVAIVTIAMMYVGFKMVFQAAEWKDVAPVFWGGVLIGGAATVAGMLGVS